MLRKSDGGLGRQVRKNTYIYIYARGKQNRIVPQRPVRACLCVFVLCVFMEEEAGAEPGLTEERWKELS